ncbi:MAG TPA: fused MFS/spermidine synthase [Chthoniobacterales bacterium]|nr:fused MFS/spermidine synthase [Chthoniobacterales bacterium]
MAFRVKRSGAILAFVLLLFFASGFAALLYQTIWQRMLGFFSGVDVYSVTITVAAFMAGLGCGSLAGGHLADRLSSRNRLLAFGLAEGIITLFALCSKWVYYDLLYVRWSALADSPVLLPMILFASLLIPTFCMGVTLPILAKTFTAKIETASTVVGYLYGVNTLGAAVGALATPWILLRHLAFPNILQIGAALNAACAIGAVLVWWWSDRAPAPGPSVHPPVAPSAEASRFPARVWMVIYALSGFIALSLEIVWFRLLGVLQKSTSFTFPSLLAVYLGGLALGVMIGVPLARRIRRPAVIFLALQSGITLYAAIAFALLLGQVDHQPFLQPLWVYLGGYEPVNAADLLSAFPAWFSGAQAAPALLESARFVLILYFILPLALIAPSTFLMGLSFPVLQKLVQDNPALLGRRVGWLQTLNIAGSMAGALLVGWCLLRWFGSSGTLKLLVVLGGIFLCLAAWHVAGRQWIRFVGVALSIVFVGCIAAAVPTSQKLWAKLHGATPRAIIAREGASGLAVLKGNPHRFEEDMIWVFSNGIGQSWLPYGGVHTQIGMFAVLLHPRPEEVAVIGLGSGDTVYALGGSPHTRQVTCIEIVEPAHDTLKELATRVPYPALQALLEDSRIRWLFTDGRAYLLRSGRQFDVIEADALRPNSAYSGNLYSWEYFQMLRARLKPGGIAVTWAPTERVLASFLGIFPHAILVDGIAIGSEQPIGVEPAEILGRLTDPFTSAYYRRVGGDLRPLVDNLVAGRFVRYSPETERPGKRDLNSDLFPKDEYMVPPQP